MSELKKFLHDLEDFELASFYHFRFNSFMKNSKEKILNELKSRNIKEYQIDKYLLKLNEKIELEIEEGKVCPKCYSDKFYNSTEIENITIQFETIRYSENYKTCLICLHSQDKIESQKEKNSIWNIFSVIKLLKKS
ncbi:MAG: hypothetical protein R3342_03650 [Lutibacter sp.]|uniref:hypothetical protein n=1 Tax=Lutibacter sp. TaxID=1925666 RepID=UPI00299CF6B5|nr:hypothetical protein [Lutibacter sp.]MDX1828621.1 hypothetical protein [Lutibacter sp.]